MARGISGARAAIARAELTRPALSEKVMKDVIKGRRDDAASLRGTGTGGWTDSDIDEYVGELDNYLNK